MKNQKIKIIHLTIYIFTFFITQVFSLSTSCPANYKIHLKTHNGRYVVAEGGGGGAANANRIKADIWETFTLIDIDGGQLLSGDEVYLQTYNGHYLVAEGGGGGTVNANRTLPRAWETFVVQKKNGYGQIDHGDAITLRAYNNQYVVAEGGGGDALNANRNWALSWETFELLFTFGNEYSGVKKTTGNLPLLVVLFGADDPSIHEHLNIYARKSDGYIYLKTTLAPVLNNDSPVYPKKTVQNVALLQNQKFKSAPFAINSVDGGLQSVFALGDDGYIYQTFMSAAGGDTDWAPWHKLPGATKFKSAPTAYNSPDGGLLSVLATGIDGYVYQIVYFRNGGGWQQNWNKLPGTNRFKSAPAVYNAPDGSLLSVLATGVDGYVYQIVYFRNGGGWQSQWSKLPGAIRFKSAPSVYNTPGGNLLSVMATGEDGYVYQILYVRGSGSRWDQWNKLPGTQKFISAPWSMNTADGKFVQVFALGEDYKMYKIAYHRGPGSQWQPEWATIADNESYASGAAAIPRLAPKKTPQYYDDLIFGSSKSVSGYYLENSYGKFTFTKAMITPWLKAKDDPSTPLDESSYEYLHHFDGQPGAIERKSNWVIEQVEKMTSFRFKDYDKNKDGKVTNDELAVLWVYPAFGDARGRGFNPGFVKVPSLPGGGLQLNMLVRGGAEMAMETIAHELAHQAFNLGDLYPDGQSFHGVGPFSLMNYGASDAQIYRWAKHLDPWSKIKMGWLSPKVITQTGVYSLRAVETHPDALIIQNPKPGARDYFIIENRWPQGSYEYRLPDQGIAVWHIDESYDHHGNWARKTIRLVSPLGQQKALWDGSDWQTGYPLSASNSNPNQTSLKWADGSPVNFSIRFSAAGSNMAIAVDFNCLDNPSASSAALPKNLSEIPLELDETLSENSEPQVSIYPNPFREQTTIQFSIAEAAETTIEIFDVQSRQIRRLLAQNFPKGDHQVEWDGKDELGRSLSAGLYLVRLSIGQKVVVKKISLQNY